MRCGKMRVERGIPGDRRGPLCPFEPGEPQSGSSAYSNVMPAGTFAVAVFHAQRNGAQMESGLFGKLEHRHGAFRTTFSVAASVTLLKHLEKFRAPAIAS
jgi:hypothetical protein